MGSCFPENLRGNSKCGGIFVMAACATGHSHQGNLRERAGRVLFSLWLFAWGGTFHVLPQNHTLQPPPGVPSFPKRVASLEAISLKTQWQVCVGWFSQRGHFEWGAILSASKSPPPTLVGCQYSTLSLRKCRKNNQVCEVTGFVFGK